MGEAEERGHGWLRCRAWGQALTKGHQAYTHTGYGTAQRKHRTKNSIQRQAGVDGGRRSRETGGEGETERTEKAHGEKSGDRRGRGAEPDSETQGQRATEDRGTGSHAPRGMKGTLAPMSTLPGPPQ